MRNLLTYDKFFDKNFLIFRSFKISYNIKMLVVRCLLIYAN